LQNKKTNISFNKNKLSDFGNNPNAMNNINNKGIDNAKSLFKVIQNTNRNNEINKNINQLNLSNNRNNSSQLNDFYNRIKNNENLKNSEYKIENNSNFWEKFELKENEKKKNPTFGNSDTVFKGNENNFNLLNPDYYNNKGYYNSNNNNEFLGKRVSTIKDYGEKLSSNMRKYSPYILNKKSI